MSNILLESLQKIHEKLSKISDISLDEFLAISSIVRIEKINTGDFFIQPGDSALKVAFTLQGLAKTYYILDNDKELISHFGIEGSFLGVYTDMLKKSSINWLY